MEIYCVRNSNKITYCHEKKIFILIFVLVNLANINAQTYRQLFDKLDVNFKNGSYSFYSNLESKLTNEPNLMQAYLRMYETTQDIKWLDKFIIHCIRIQHHRDDQIAYFQNEVAVFKIEETIVLQ